MLPFSAVHLNGRCVLPGVTNLLPMPNTGATTVTKLEQLIQRARDVGATVHVKYDQTAAEFEGRQIIESVTVYGLPGCGNHPMSAIGAQERLAQLLGPEPELTVEQARAQIKAWRDGEGQTTCAQYWRRKASEYADQASLARRYADRERRRANRYAAGCAALAVLLIVAGVVL